MKKTFTLALAFVAIGLSAAFLSCAPRSEGSPTPLRVAAPALEQNALIYVAASKNYFASNGLDVTIQDLDTGAASLSALAKGEAQIAETAEFPLVNAILAGGELRVVAINDRFENDYLVFKKDSGIARFADLKGKRIGVTQNAIGAFYLDRFLDLSGMQPKDIILVDTKPADFETALLSGRVDALVAWQPYVGRIEKAMADKVGVWPVQNKQQVYGLLVCDSTWLGGNTAAVQRFLKSLRMARDFLVKHPDEAKAVVAKRLGLEAPYLESVWPRHQFDLSLDNSLVVAMEDEARWKIDNGDLRATSLPDFVRTIYRQGLDAAYSAGQNMMR